MEWWESLYLLNVFCVWFSAKCAIDCFARNNDTAGYLNLFASALNGAIVFAHFI